MYSFICGGIIPKFIGETAKMDINKISVGENAPDIINVIIEIPEHYVPVKYEIDKDSGAVMVDRFMAAPMFYPANYGFVPHTLSPDGDPIDVLVVTPYPLVIGSVISARPVGMLDMTDESGQDHKILAVPTNDLCVQYAEIKNYSDLPAMLIKQISHFFEYYKKLEPGKWVRIDGWEDADAAKQAITESITAYKNES